MLLFKINISNDHLFYDYFVRLSIGSSLATYLFSRLIANNKLCYFDMIMKKSYPVSMNRRTDRLLSVEKIKIESNVFQDQRLRCYFYQALNQCVGFPLHKLTLLKIKFLETKKLHSLKHR